METIDAITAFQRAHPDADADVLASAAERARDAAMRRRSQYFHKKTLVAAYAALTARGSLPRHPFFEHALVSKAVRSASGVLPVTIITAPHTVDAATGAVVPNFTCSYDCAFCPNETRANGAAHDIARSYLSTEPAVARGLENGFETKRMVWARLWDLERLGHTVDKLEVIVLGGTLDSHRRSYLKAFFRDIYYACNVWASISPARRGPHAHLLRHWTGAFDPDGDVGRAVRPPRTLEEEQAENSAVVDGAHVIGIVVETRPDCVTPASTLEKRAWGVTRVQLGVQHTDSAILAKVTRGHTALETARAFRTLLDNAFKVDAHLMPDLPGTTIAADVAMCDAVLRGQRFVPDYCKLYPCVDVPYTAIRKWKETGEWRPLAESSYPAFLRLMVRFLAAVPPWTRINRIHRDFPEAAASNAGVGFVSAFIRSNFRQQLAAAATAAGAVERDIRAREVMGAWPHDAAATARLQVRVYRNAGGTEFFLSVELPPRAATAAGGSAAAAVGETRRAAKLRKAAGSEAAREAQLAAREAVQARRAAARAAAGADGGPGGQGGAGDGAAGVIGGEGEKSKPAPPTPTPPRKPPARPPSSATAAAAAAAAAGGGSGVEAIDVSADVAPQDRGTLLALLRLRIPDWVALAAPPPSHVVEALAATPTALVRELHVYGAVVGVSADGDAAAAAGGSAGEGSEAAAAAAAQHRGLGSFLMAVAEELAAACGAQALAVISGVGVRRWYAKRGYALDSPPPPLGGWAPDDAAPAPPSGARPPAPTAAGVPRVMRGGYMIKPLPSTPRGGAEVAGTLPPMLGATLPRGAVAAAVAAASFTAQKYIPAVAALASATSSRAGGAAAVGVAKHMYRDIPDAECIELTPLRSRPAATAAPRVRSSAAVAGAAVVAVAAAAALAAAWTLRGRLRPARV